jgi:2TM family of unknown function (DUF5676)
MGDTVAIVTPIVVIEMRNAQPELPPTVIIDGRLPSSKQGGQIMLNIRVVTWSMGLFTTVSFILCVIWGLVTPESLHMHQFLEIVLPAFKWLSVGGFFLGLIESFLWGAYVGLVFVSIYNALYRHWSLP